MAANGKVTAPFRLGVCLAQESPELVRTAWPRALRPPSRRRTDYESLGEASVSMFGKCYLGFMKTITARGRTDDIRETRCQTHSTGWTRRHLGCSRPVWRGQAA